MDEPNPYRAPEAKIAEPMPEPAAAGQAALPLAGRMPRLIASLIDTLLLLALVVPIMFAVGYSEAIPQDGSTIRHIAMEILVTVVVFFMFVAIQAFPLQASGQTWGKRLLGIRIVDLDGAKPGLWRLLALRYLPLNAVAVIPLFGMLVAVADALMIFRADRRCLHDLMAGTRVVDARRGARP